VPCTWHAADAIDEMSWRTGAVSFPSIPDGRPRWTV
jgi:hypothetical protein